MLRYVVGSYEAIYTVYFDQNNYAMDMLQMGSITQLVRVWC
jgi:hypothetical protein